jgi:hypothetical protein
MVKKLVFLLCLALLLGLAGSNTTSGATLDLRLTNGNDDAEEHLSNGSMDITSSDLEFPYEDNANPTATDPQLNVLRFALPIPKGAQITKAYVEFEQDETKGNDKPVNVVIEAQLVPNAPAVTSAAKNLSSRTPWTTAKVKWTIPTGMANDTKFQSPDLAAVLTEIISQDGWANGNAVLLAIRDDPDSPSNGLRCVESVEGEATAAPLLHVEVFIPQATAPQPADGAVAVTMPLLNWTAGDGAVAHNVYIGTTADLGAANLAGPQQPVAMYFHVAGLEPGVTYYWRVDEIAADGKVTTGDVWKFTAEPLVAWAPSPAPGATGLLPSQTLSWSPGTGAVQHQVFLSASQSQVSAGAAAADKGKIAETKLATGLLAAGTTYYWRVDEITGDGKVNQGAVWSFATADPFSKKVVWEKWLNIGSGVLVSDLTSNANYPAKPTEVELLDSFQSAVDWADNYGQRLYAWLTPPESGDYTFWIAGDDAQELWLSTDDDPAKAVLIASVSGWTPALDFDNTGGGQGGTNQKSAPIKLEANKKYYIVALGKEGGGGDSTAVAWQGPGLAAREVISAQYLDTNAQGYFAVPPIGQPSYTYQGEAAAFGAGETTDAGTSLDGTWSHENGSDAWDGSAPGAGAPGGAGVFVEDTVTFLRIQDTGDPRDYGKPDPSNRKLYFQHPVTRGLDGAHLEIRIRVATTGVLDPVNPDGGAGVSPWPAAGVGTHIRDDGKGMFGIAQPGVGIISFSLAQAGEPDFPTAATDLLVMNNLVGTTSSGDVDTGVATATANTMALEDATQWNTFVIDIAAGGKGTHVVTVSVNGGAPQSFDVTAGTGLQGTLNYIALGSSGTGPYTAFDVDYLRIFE